MKSLGDTLNPEHPLTEYPRPQMVRGSFFCLNGIWQYSINKSEVPPRAWDGDIVVPYPVESALSGVGRVLGPSDCLWYRKTFTLPGGFNAGRVLLHFGAVDECCEVRLNGVKVGQHDGGYLPFHFDVTAQLAAGENELTVFVIDETDKAPYARGGQRLAQGGRFHSPVSGIWQTVWLESVPDTYIKDLRILPLYDESAVEVVVFSNGGPVQATVEVFARSTLAAVEHCTTGQPVRLSLPGALSWHPKNPFLYTVRVTSGEDRVASYFGMRKFSLAPDEEGHVRLLLNNKLLFVTGVLDSGLYGDGLYTPPTDAVMERDIRFAKECGFNAIRKVGKIESMRWYYHCDRLGMLVWQDLPGGGKVPGKTAARLAARFTGDKNTHRFGSDNTQWRQAYLRDMVRSVKLLYNTPSVQTWVLFNEGQGQFCAEKNARRMQSLDPARLIDHASGWRDQGAGDITSLHFYKSAPQLPQAKSRRAVVFTSVGDFGLPVEDHFAGSRPCASRLFSGEGQLIEAMQTLYRTQLLPLVQEGLAGVFFRQLADGQDDASGLLSADREAEKLPKGMMAELNRPLHKE